MEALLMASGHATNDGGHMLVVSISIFVAVLCLCIVIGHLLENRWVNQSITTMVLGCIVGTVILFLSKGSNSHILRFDEQLFFIYLLPPIIFNAGFKVKKKQFFHNFLTIMLFGVVGVFISSAIISAGSRWLFPKIGLTGLEIPRAIFSSTDTVCTLQLGFGEGVVNDATSVVLFNAIQKLDVSKIEGWKFLHVFGDFLYLFSTSTILGVATGLLTAYVIRSLYFGRHSTNREISLMALMAYLSYMLAELFRLSSILAVFFCGIVMSHYAWHNVTESSRTTTRHAFATMSFIAETFIFLYVGMDALDIEKWKVAKTRFKTLLGIYSVIIFLVLLGRAVFVFPLSILSNYMSPNSERSAITFKHQVIIWWAGLMRGAVSIALAFNQFTDSGVTWNPVHATMITSTLIVVLFSTLVFGLLTKPLVSILLPHHTMENNLSSDTGSPKDDITLPLLSLEDAATKSSFSLLLERPAHTIHAYWRRFDDTYMRPVFGGPLRAATSRRQRLR